MKVPGCIGPALPWIRRAALLVFLCPLLLAQPAQNVSPGEVHVSSRPWQPAVIHVRTTEIEVDVVVRDKKGKNVAGLNRQDFTIYDDGQPQQLSHFTVVDHTPRSAKPAQPDQPAATTLPASVRKTEAAPAPPRSRHVALFFDDFHMPPGDVRHVQVAAENFIRTGLSRGDGVGLFTASGSPRVNFTPNASRVLSALPDLRSHLREFGGGYCPRMTPYDAYLIANNLDPTAFDNAVREAMECYCDGQGNYEGDACRQMQVLSVREKARAIWEPTLELSQDTLSSLHSVIGELAQMPGDRVLLLASSGFYTDPRLEPTSGIIDEALQSGIVINAIDARGLFTTVPAHWQAQTQGPSASPAAVLAALRRAEMFGTNVLASRAAMADFVLGTGGRFFRDRNDITAGYYQLAEAPRTEYLLDFTPEKLDGKYHKLRVAVTIPGNYDVQARPGYFAPKRDEAEPVTVQSRLDAAVMRTHDESKFPSTITYQVRHSPSGARELLVSFHVDLKKLPVVHQEGHSLEQLDFVAALFDMSGGFVAGKQGEMDLALKPPTYEQLSKEGIEASMVIPVEPGEYKLRTVVEEAQKGRIVSHSEKITVQ